MGRLDGAKLVIDSDWYQVGTNEETPVVARAVAVATLVRDAVTDSREVGWTMGGIDVDGCIVGVDIGGECDS